MEDSGYAVSGVSTSGLGHIQTPAASDTQARCPSVQKALRFYTKRWQHWTELRSGAAASRGTRDAHLQGCPRYLLHILRAKALAAHREWNRWFVYQYAWFRWLPEKFQRVGACETGYGERPGSWTWDSGTYVSAFGIYRPAYEQYHRWTGRNTPREQYEVAAAIQARYGWGAWGCGGA